VLSVGLGTLKQVSDVARRAGVEIMRVYNSDFSVNKKDDGSPITEADTAAETIILRSIREGISSDFPIVSEEAVSVGNLPDVQGMPFWLVDPLDGTKEFISRNGEFTVNIALIENNKPVLGVVYLPVKGITYMAAVVGAFIQEDGSERREISCRQAPADGLVAVVSRSHRTPEVDDYLSPFTITRETSAGSSLKFCTVAEGLADIYPRLGRTMEWDTAAGHAVLKFAGGTVQRLDGSASGSELSYGKPGHENPHFAAAGPGILPSAAS